MRSLSISFSTYSLAWPILSSDMSDSVNCLPSPSTSEDFFFFFILPKLLVEGIWSWVYIWKFDLELVLVREEGNLERIGCSL